MFLSKIIDVIKGYFNYHVTPVKNFFDDWISVNDDNTRKDIEGKIPPFLTNLL